MVDNSLKLEQNLSEVVIFSILFSESPIDFLDKTLDVLDVKNPKYFLHEKYIK